MGAFRNPSGNSLRNFSPPLAMQQSMWDSIVNGNLIDAKIFAFSRRSREPGRVDTPKVLFVNTHVLAAACSYFQSTSSFSNGTETDLGAGLPPGMEPCFDLAECDLDSDFDDLVDDDPMQLQLRASSDTLESARRPIKAYLVKFMAYKTLRAIIWYIYTGEISFSSDSPEVPRASAKSVYRFAHEHSMGHLETLASKAIESSINRLSPSELVEEACSIFVSRYPEWCRVYIKRLSPVLSRDSEAKRAFERKLSAYFSGMLPHCKEIITSTVLHRLGHRIPPEVPRGDRNVIPRVSQPWPDETKDALRRSFDSGTFDDFKLSLTFCLVHFPSARMDDDARSWLGPAFTSSFSLSTWQALAYFMNTGGITFKPFGSTHVEQSTSQSPSDPQFRGFPCSMKETYSLASELHLNQLTGIVTNAMVSSLTLENVVWEMFSGSPLPGEAIKRGAEIIRENSASTSRVSSQLREMVAEAADGSRSRDFVAFAECFRRLY